MVSQVMHLIHVHCIHVLSNIFMDHMTRIKQFEVNSSVCGLF